MTTKSESAEKKAETSETKAETSESKAETSKTTTESGPTRTSSGGITEPPPKENYTTMKDKKGVIRVASTVPDEGFTPAPVDPDPEAVKRHKAFLKERS